MYDLDFLGTQTKAPEFRVSKMREEIDGNVDEVAVNT